MSKAHKELNNNQISGYFRANVGILLINREGLVLAAERKDTPGAWQLPQGGIDQGEDEGQAALREMREELGFDEGDLKSLLLPLGSHPGWLAYQLPSGNWSGKHGRGQVQKFFAYRFLGRDEQLQAKFGASQEFSAWKWVSMSELVKGAWEFRRPVYEALRQAFAGYLSERELTTEEAGLIWDEYKYRHDLIWKHLIRSTTAVIALLAVQFLNSFTGGPLVVFAANLLAIGYTAFTYWILGPELDLLDEVKDKHRERQMKLLGMHMYRKGSGGVPFRTRVRIYVLALLFLSVVAAILYGVNPGG